MADGKAEEALDGLRKSGHVTISPPNSKYPRQQLGCKTL